MELKIPATWMEKYLALVHQFNLEIIGLPIPSAPSRLDPERKQWASGAMSEELSEFMDAETLEDEVDALLDLSYFALGRVIEMGVLPGASFEEVHDRNMSKKRGELSKRPFAHGFDAVKPEGWTPPNLLPYLSLTRSEALLAYDAKLRAQKAAEAAPSLTAEPGERGKPKLLVLGHARHGKDTVAEILQREYGFTFTSSSLFGAEKIIWNAIHYPNEALNRHEAAGSPGMDVEALDIELAIMIDRDYQSVQACFEERSNFREAWFSLIAAYNYPEKDRLAREIFAENDIYVGVRNKREYYAIVNSGIVDGVIWVDASERCKPEAFRSCTVEPWMSNWTIDNNGTEDELHRNVHQLMSYLCIERNAK